MPHAIIEYSQEMQSIMQAEQIVPLVHNILTECGLFEPENVKTRAYKAEDFCVGTKGRTGNFVHVTVYIMQGRSVEQRRALSEKLVDALGRPFHDIDQLTVDIRELERDIYRKYSANSA